MWIDLSKHVDQLVVVLKQGARDRANCIGVQVTEMKLRITTVQHKITPSLHLPQDGKIAERIRRDARNEISAQIKCRKSSRCLEP